MISSDIILEFKMIGAGIINAISISNTKKITANRKNRVEKGIRADLFGSKPHSKGDDFSRSIQVRMDRTNPNNKIAIEIINVNPIHISLIIIHKKYPSCIFY